jgi:hypothetical protein
MLSEAKHLDLFSFGESVEKRSEILRFAQNDISERGKVLFSRDLCESRVTPK